VFVHLTNIGKGILGDEGVNYVVDGTLSKALSKVDQPKCFEQSSFSECAGDHFQLKAHKV
jgi:hypothetical protein